MTYNINDICNGRGSGFSRAIDISTLYRPQARYIVRESEYNHIMSYYDIYDETITYVRTPILYKNIVIEVIMTSIHQ